MKPTSVSQVLSAVAPVDPSMVEQVQQRLDRKTKPPGSLGRLEDLACRYAAARNTLAPGSPKGCVVVMAADHGVAEEGVSAYPQEVTQQMLLNLAKGGAAINAITEAVGAQLLVIDMGVKGSTPAGVISRRVAAGTSNMVHGAAMTMEQALRAFQIGMDTANELAEQGITLVGLGEMGIANTTAASALTATLTGRAVEDVVGSGTGLEPFALRHKVQVVGRALEVNRVDATRPFEVLAAVGGLEIAALAGLTVGAASKRMAVLLDGFISSSAALVASKVYPTLGGYLFASHCSSEPGHRAILEELDLTELLDMRLRLGEGTGAALAMPLFSAAVSVLTNMATFESAGVSTRNA